MHKKEEPRDCFVTLFLAMTALLYWYLAMTPDPCSLTLVYYV